MTTSTLFCALLASGLAALLARENKLRRAFQDLVARLLAKIREQAGFPYSPGPEARSQPPRPRSHTRA